MTTAIPKEMEFYREKHIEYIKSLDKKVEDVEYWYSGHLRMSGVYWGLTALEMMGSSESLPRDEVIEFVLSTQHSNGGFGSMPKYDPHLLYTLSAIQILFMEDALDRIDGDKVASYIATLQLPDGSFQGDQYGEVDSRFVFTAIQALSLLDKLEKVDTEKTVQWIMKCRNFDGGFGLVPGAESHAAQIFTCVGTLSILNRLDLLEESKDLTCWWLAERQVKSGGLNGRPEKLPDVCYSWWVLSTLAIFKRVDWIDGEKLRQFILAAQNEEVGGIADREGDEADVFHTIFGIAGLSLLGYENLDLIDPTYCLPARLIPKIKNFTKTY